MAESPEITKDNIVNMLECARDEDQAQRYLVLGMDWPAVGLWDVLQ